MRHAKKSTNRDFRMTFKEVPEPEPEEEEGQEDAPDEEVWRSCFKVIGLQTSIVTRCQLQALFLER